MIVILALKKLGRLKELVDGCSISSYVAVKIMELAEMMGSITRKKGALAPIRCGEFMECLIDDDRVEVQQVTIL